MVSIAIIATAAYLARALFGEVGIGIQKSDGLLICGSAQSGLRSQLSSHSVVTR
jgi:hypothetical protein